MNYTEWEGAKRKETYMIRETGYRTYEEAAKRAEALLWEDRKDRERLTTTEHTRNDSEGNRIPFAYIEDSETGATAYIYSLDPEGSSYSLTYLTGEEAKEGNRTYPYRETPKERIPFLMALSTPIFKPVREISPEEALTPDGLREIYSFFGEDHREAKYSYGFLTKEEVEAEAFTKDTAFENIGYEDGTTETGSLLCLPFPQDLQQLTGVKVKTASDYAKGISKLLGGQLSEDQEREAIGTFLFYSSEALLRYAIYEFFRTEDYSHLKEVLSCYGNFHLPKNWEEGFPLFHSYRIELNSKLFTTEEYVLAKYLSKWNATIAELQSRIREVAEYTGTPLSLMSKANRVRHIWDF